MKSVERIVSMLVTQTTLRVKASMRFWSQWRRIEKPVTAVRDRLFTRARLWEVRSPAFEEINE